MDRQRGFTLVELMVALAVFAITATIVLQQSSRSVRLQKNLEDTSLATWVAQNQLAELRSARFDLRAGEQRRQIRFANREWQVSLLTERSPDGSVYKSLVTVFASDEQAPVQVSLTGYLVKEAP